MRRKRRRPYLWDPCQARHRDMKNVKRLRRALDDASGRLRLLSAHTRGIIFELDSRARFVRVFASDPQLLARPEQEILGRTIPDVLGPDVGRRHHEAVRATLETGVSARYEYELDVPNGHRHFACESVAVPDISGNQRHAVFWIRDITEQVQLQKKLILTERLASVGTLAAGVAHEINNPLTYMMLNAEQLQKAFHHLTLDATLGDRLDAMRQGVNVISEGIRHVKHIVNELLQLAKPDDPIEPVDVRQAIGLSLDLTRTICERHARITTSLEDVPRVLAHHRRLVQVFSNLLTNAAEAIPPGSPEDNEIAVSVCSAGSDCVQVAFRDTGEGISEEDLEHIFDPFFTTKTHGTGLGLAICQRIVSSFNGEIRFERGRPRGSVLRVLLPAAPSVPGPG
jgi:two-component system, NtrC family, sensor kinase